MAAALPRLASVPGLTVTPDAALTPLDDGTTSGSTATPTTVYKVAREIGARRYWRNGFTGKGVDVAVIDTGVSPVPGPLSPSGRHPGQEAVVRLIPKVGRDVSRETSG